MKEDTTTYEQEIIREYKRIAENNTASKISFFKKYESFLDKVPLDKKLNIVVDFQLALFHNGEFDQYLIRCDDLINCLFDSDLFPDFPKHILEELLFHKAACQLNLYHYRKSEQTMKALIVISEKSTPTHHALLSHLFRTKRKFHNFRARGFAITLILAAAIMSIWSALAITPSNIVLFPIYEMCTIVLLLSGTMAWIGPMIYHHHCAHQDAKKFIAKHQSK
ncbi:MAG: hypothetical protein V3V00_07405 [Saprospiraceae bacterium]